MLTREFLRELGLPENIIDRLLEAQQEQPAEKDPFEQGFDNERSNKC